MSHEITNTEPDIDHVARFQSLQAGQYWRALQDIVEEGIDKDTVLLIESIRWVDDAPHTIILRPHPSKIGKDTYLHIPQEDGTTQKKWFRFREHRFLLKDFLAQFEFEPDHQIVRGEELRQIQGKINSLQGELIEAQSNPALLADVVEARLREQRKAAVDSDEKSETGQGTTLPAVPDGGLVSLATGTVVDALGTGITVEGIASLKEAAGREHQVATIKAEWIQGKTSEIAETIGAMTPFYSEQAAAALAQTEDVRSYVAKLMRGIESLDLYVGKDVEVETIRTGDSAPKDMPLTFVQKKLLMDEELAVWADIDEWFDFSKEDKFFEALREHDSLVNQIFPTERCVLVMAVTRRDIDYGDAFTNNARNAENKKVFLLVRDGMNVHRVFSPVESHLHTARLFPSKNDQDGMFRGLDGSHIKFEDVAYTDKLAAHEKFALHYKRFLLLVCGLDHRLKLFGDFYEGPQSFHFVSMDFQEKHCRFLHDDDGSGLLPSGENRMPLKEWIAEKNSYLRSGSRVLCNWYEVMNPDTAPGACKEESARSRGFDRRYSPKTGMDVAIAYREGDSICADVEVSGYSYSSHGQRSFNCKVNLSKFENGNWDYTDQPFLCLDAVRPEELHWYIHNRETRQDHLSYIRFFKRALKHIQYELSAESDTRQRLAKALADGNVAFGDEADGIIHQAVIAWRAAHRGKPLPCFDGNSAPAAWKSLLDQMYMLAGEGKRRTSEIEAFIRGLGYDPLRLVLSGGAKLVVYAAPRADECDNRIEPHAWVHRITVERGKTKYVEKSRRWAVLPKSAASETTLHQWDTADQWSGRDSVFPSYERKQEILGEATDFAGRLHPFTRTMGTATHSLQLDDWVWLREELMRESKYVLNPYMAVPFGMVYYPRTKELRYLCVGSRKPHALLYRLAPDEMCRERVRSSFIKPYAKKDKARADFEAAIESPSVWLLLEVTISLSQSRYGVYCHHEAGVTSHDADCKKRFDPMLANWFENWIGEVKKYGRVWIAPGAVDENGRLMFDDMLGITPPEGLDPVRVVEITLSPNGDAQPLEFSHWFDIFKGAIEPGDFDGMRKEMRLLTEGVDPDGSCGRRAETYHMASPEEARDFIKGKIVYVNGAAVTAVPAANLPDAPAAPEGVERWYLVGGGA